MNTPPGNFSILRSGTFWFTVLGAAAHITLAAPADRPRAAVEGISAVGAAWRLRKAVAKNGANR